MPLRLFRFSFGPHVSLTVFRDGHFRTYPFANRRGTGKPQGVYMSLRLGIALTNPYSKGTYVLSILPDCFPALFMLFFLH